MAGNGMRPNEGHTQRQAAESKTGFEMIFAGSPASAVRPVASVPYVSTCLLHIRFVNSDSDGAGSRERGAHPRSASAVI